MSINVILVGDWDTPTINNQPSWTVFNRTVGSMAVFRDDDGTDQLYIGDALQPKIYRYNKNIYSDNTFGYRRVWRSKKFTLGRRADWNNSMHVILEGTMRTITEFKVKVIVDGKSQDYIIDNNQIVVSGGTMGAQIGDRLIGDELIGGNGAPSDKLRYIAVLEIPNALRYTNTIEVEVSNEAPGQYWSIDYLSINEKIDYANIPSNHKNVRSV